MSKVFEYTSDRRLETMSDINKAKNELICEMCNFFEVERKDIRLQQGMITLYGHIVENGELNGIIPLTNKITDFKKYVDNNSYKYFHLKTKLEKK